MSDQIASLDILGVRPDGTRLPIRFCVEAPYRNVEASVEEWRCAVVLYPLYSNLSHAAGTDSMQSLCMALSLGLDLLSELSKTVAVCSMMTARSSI